MNNYEFRIPNSDVHNPQVGIRNSEFGIGKCGLLFHQIGLYWCVSEVGQGNYFLCA